MSEKKTSSSTRKGKNWAEKVNILLGKWSNATAWPFLFFFLWCQSALFACSLASPFLSRVYHHMVYSFGAFDVCVCVCAFCCRFEMYFSKMNDIYRNRNAPKVLHACAHSATFSFSQVSCFLSFAVVFLLCFAPHHSIDPVLIATKIVSACACMHMRMRKRTTENHLSAHGRSRKQNRNQETKKK